MYFLYSLFVKLYYVAVLVSSVFNSKARLWINGRKRLLQQLTSTLKTDERRVWFHAASLGEFEQGRPVLEEFRRLYPDIKIVLTFFSPSGYEVRKDYSKADYIFYLPLDTKKNAREFINLVNPEFVFFIKYEFWLNFINYLAFKEIPFILFSAIFREEQIFFKPYGKIFLKVLPKFHHIFVQNISSVQLLNNFGMYNCSMAGDTRFDRVSEIVKSAGSQVLLQQFAINNFVVIAGSTWPADERLLYPIINKSGIDVKWIIAPHEIGADHLQSIEKNITKPLVKYSELTPENCSAKVLLIDNIGMLSTLYQYGKIAYIGGGFGSGIHNILEATTWGLPVLFGPNYKRFSEAVELTALGAAFPVAHTSDVEYLINEFKTSRFYLSDCRDVCLSFVGKNIGATDLVIKSVQLF